MTRRKRRTHSPELKARMGELFERKNARSKDEDNQQRHIANLERKIGQLTIERDWLEKKVHGDGDRLMRKS